MTFDDTYRVGRCPNTHCRVQLASNMWTRTDRPAYAWKASTGLRLDDGMRCPRCGEPLQRTSREARGMRAFTEDELLKVFEQTSKTLAERVAAWQSRVTEWEAAEPSEAQDYRLGAYRGYLAEAQRDQARVEDGFHNWLWDDPEVLERSAS